MISKNEGKKTHNENINKIGGRIYGEQFVLRFV